MVADVKLSSRTMLPCKYKQQKLIVKKVMIFLDHGTRKIDAFAQT